MPHMEGEHEIHGLRFWDGDPTVRLLMADDDLVAMLLERCEPGTVLRALPESEQDVVISGLLRRLWRSPSSPHPFRSLSTLTEYWTSETLGQSEQWPDVGLVREGLQLLKELPRNASSKVLLATDLHAGNVVRAEREPWLVIDPKPLSGDPHYEVAPLLWNRWDAFGGGIRTGVRSRFDAIVEVAELDADRARHWVVVRMVHNAMSALTESTDPQPRVDRDWLTICVSVAKAVQP